MEFRFAIYLRVPISLYISEIGPLRNGIHVIRQNLIINLLLHRTAEPIPRKHKIAILYNSSGRLPVESLFIPLVF
jgi:hypothetical protein